MNLALTGNNMNSRVSMQGKDSRAEIAIMISVKASAGSFQISSNRFLEAADFPDSTRGDLSNVFARGRI